MQFSFHIYLPEPDSLMTYKEWLAMELERRYGRTLCTEILEFEKNDYMFQFETSTKPGFENSALYDMRQYFRPCGEIYMIDGSASDGPSPPRPAKGVLPEPKLETPAEEMEQAAIWKGYHPK